MDNKIPRTLPPISIDCKFRSLFDRLTRPYIDQADPVSFCSKSITLPQIPIPDIVEICESVQSIFSEESIVLNLEGPLVIVGDLHGHLVDLYRILATYGLPKNNRYLFLGDLVDRGEFSLETVIIIFLMKIFFKSDVYIIRGNHEFEEMCKDGGFYQELHSIYGNEAPFQIFLSTFAEMPIAARVNQKIFCVHGGIGPGVVSINQIQLLERPIITYDNDLIGSLLWSDPLEDVEGFQESSRGVGYAYGPETIDQLSELWGIDVFVRGHECVQKGAQEMFGGKLLTVFSASNYCGFIGNQSAVMEVSTGSTYKVRKFEPIKHIMRNSANFVDTEQHSANKMRHHSTGRIQANASCLNFYQKVQTSPTARKAKESFNEGQIVKPRLKGSKSQSFLLVQKH